MNKEEKIEQFEKQFDKFIRTIVPMIYSIENGALSNDSKIRQTDKVIAQNFSIIDNYDKRMTPNMVMHVLDTIESLKFFSRVLTTAKEPVKMKTLDQTINILLGTLRGAIAPRELSEELPLDEDA